MTDNRVSKPFFLYDSSTGWYEQPGGSGAAPTYSYEAYDSGKIRLRKWRVADFDATAGAGTATTAPASAP
ncbi:hypothetical protein CH252_05840 [Rhodococcus sp. 06-1477-1B]|nr:hypothetical protein CH252_05840 [Rhodococcus sp. 06-1477-1B]